MTKSAITAVVLTGLMSTTALAAPPAWVVTDADSRIVLFPTVHVLQDGLEWKTGALLDEIETADEVWTELGQTDTPEMAARLQALVAERGTSPDTPLSSRLTQEQVERLNALTRELGMPDGALEPLKPWMAALAVTQTVLAKAGLAGERGVESELRVIFDNRPVRNFETPAQQIAFMAEMDMEEQIEFLMQAVDGASDMGDTLTRVTEGWAKGDVSTMENELLMEMRTNYPEAFATFFVERNTAWTDIIETELAGSGTDFIAVGAGHLVGEDSVPDLLRERGYIVERMSLED